MQKIIKKPVFGHKMNAATIVNAFFFSGEVRFQKNLDQQVKTDRLLQTAFRNFDIAAALSPPNLETTLTSY